MGSDHGASKPKLLDTTSGFLYFVSASYLCRSCCFCAINVGERTHARVLLFRMPYRIVIIFSHYENGEKFREQSAAKLISMIITITV